MKILQPATRKDATRKPGFTLVELLVVIAIIGVLVGLLLPAVQSVREAARKVECENNLKQLALALQNHHDTLGAFPVGISTFGNSDPAGTTLHGPNWMIRILPYMEQQGLYNRFDLRKPISDPANREARGHQLDTIMCPSEAYKTFFDGGPEEGDNWARTNYAANSVNAPLAGNNNSPPSAVVGPIPVPWSHDQAWADDQRRGVMSFNKGAHMGEIVDGTSNTMLLGEVRAGLTAHDRRGVWAMGTAGASCLFWHGFSGDANGPNERGDFSDDIKGCGQVVAEVGMAAMRRRKMGCFPGSNSSYQATVRSSHPGGAMIAKCDGSVHFIHDSIETNGPFGPCCSTWDRLIASGDGYTLGDY